MICTTIRKGIECTFMKTNGCSYVKGYCVEVPEQCAGCARIIELESGRYCAVSPEPLKKWKLGYCNLATHHLEEKVAAKTKINPLKASKRGKKK